MTMTEQLAAISEKTAKPKRKPRGKPFQKGQSGNPRHAAGIGFALVLLLLAALWATLAHAASDYPLLSYVCAAKTGAGAGKSDRADRSGDYSAGEAADGRAQD